MPNPKDRAAARIAPATSRVPPMVPDHIRALYMEELAHIPRVHVAVRKIGSSEHLPVGKSFYS